MTGPTRPSLAVRAARPVARVMSALLEPTWYWLGLLDPDGHPANSKLVYTAAAFTALALVVVLGLRLVEKGQPLTLEYVLLVSIVLLFCATVEGFKKFMRMRFPGGAAAPRVPDPPAGG